MVLSSLRVEKLYGNYLYMVNFNRDITLLYGENGCGKTTILNIITAIITGSLYKLFSYRFEKIELSYLDEKKSNTLYSILINKNDDQLKVLFKDREETIIKMQIPEERRRRDGFEDFYFEEYDILNQIRAEFNYVYLALNRATSLSDHEEYKYRRRFFSEEDCEIVEPETINPEIRYVENLISKRYLMATTQSNKINDEFRNSILKSSLDVNVQTDFNKLVSAFNFKEFSKGDNLKIKSSYLKILSDLKLVSDEEKKQYIVFFEKYSERIKSLNDNNKIDIEKLFSLFIEYNEMKKIQRIVDIAEDAESQKAIVMKPMELFLKTVNDFISTSNLKKTITIGLNGRVYFTTDDCEQKLSVQYLSSGERQLLVFFANLIFGVKDTSSGIFVVDEPELSLHLSWQKVFLKKALGINSNVQFIFATHSPEIVGSYRDKMEKLVRKTLE